MAVQAMKHQMRSGDIDRFITIQRATVTYNEVNEPEETWSVLATAWAELLPQRGTERFTAAEVAGSAVVTLRMRYQPNLAVTDRVLHDGKTWNIVDIREVHRRAIHEIDMVARSE